MRRTSQRKLYHCFSNCSHGQWSDLPCCVSMRWLKEHGRVLEMDTKFEHPRIKILGGSELSMQGVVRDIQFRFKGSNKTFRRDFLVSKALDDWYDFLLSKDFINGI